MSTPEERDALERRAIIANARLVASEWRQRLPAKLAAGLHELESPAGARPTTCAVCGAHRSDARHLRDRGIYEIRSRNLLVGTFDLPNGMFIGIREKMGSVYLFGEQNIGTSGHGTAWPLRDLGTVPEGIELRERLDSTCDACPGRTVEFEDGRLRAEPSYWRHRDDRSPLTSCGGRSVVQPNAPLFDLLKVHNDEVTARLVGEQDAEMVDTPPSEG